MSCPVCRSAWAEIWRERGLYALRCGECGYVGSHGAEPVVYEDDYFSRWYLERREERLGYFEALFDRLAQDSAIGEPLLDVGAGVGHWLEVCRRHGRQALAAVEPSRFGREQLGKLAQGPLAGLAVHASLDAVPEKDKGDGFATLTLLDVLSHVDDLPGTLAAARRRLRPGGRLVVKAPEHPVALFRTARALAPLGRGRALVAARSQHHHFARESFPGLMERLGFTTLSCQPLRELDVSLGVAPGAWALQRLARALVGGDSLLWVGSPAGTPTSEGAPPRGAIE